MKKIDKSMRINAPRGQKVIFTGPRDSLWGGGFADERLEIEKVFVVDKTKVFGSHSEVVLVEYPEEVFNTVMFEEAGEILEPLHTTKELYRRGIGERKNSSRKSLRSNTAVD